MGQLPGLGAAAHPLTYLLGRYIHLERHGAGWESMRDGVDIDDGWPLYLARYQHLTREQDPA